MIRVEDNLTDPVEFEVERKPAMTWRSLTCGKGFYLFADGRTMPENFSEDDHRASCFACREFAPESEEADAVRYIFSLRGIERNDDGTFNLWTGNEGKKGREILRCSESVMLAVRRTRWGA